MEKNESWNNLRFSFIHCERDLRVTLSVKAGISSVKSVVFLINTVKTPCSLNTYSLGYGFIMYTV